MVFAIPTNLDFGSWLKNTVFYRDRKKNSFQLNIFVFKIFFFLDFEPSNLHYHGWFYKQCIYYGNSFIFIIRNTTISICCCGCCCCSINYPIKLKREALVPCLLRAHLPARLRHRVVVQAQHGHDLI